MLSTPPTNTSAIDRDIHAPAEPQDAPLYLPTDVTPEKLFQAIGRLRKEARDEIDRLIRFLDETDNHMELEDSIDDNPQGEGGDDEPSLGSFDRMADQSKAWTSRDPMAAMRDGEQDDCDHEDSDPAEESEASGIGDQDGLDEQVPFRDWQGVGMV